MHAKADVLRAQGRVPVAASRSPVGEPAPSPVVDPSRPLDSAHPSPPAPSPGAAPARPVAPAPATPSPVADPALELRLTIAVVPVFLVVAVAFNGGGGGVGHFLQRTFLTMPVHELGHAVAAWLCGFAALPTLWRTLTADERGLLTPLLLAGVLAFGAWRAWRADARACLVACAVVGVAQAWCTLVWSARAARQFITFGGDAVGMVLATALMATFFVGKRTQLYAGALRWGFAGIGAAAFVDMFGGWWAARRDPERIPYGELEGVGHTDPTVLVEQFRWTEAQLVWRHVAVGVVCLCALVAVYAWAVRRARRFARDGRG